MQDLQHQEDREKFIEDFLNQNQQEDLYDNVEVIVQDGEQVEETIPSMPTELATPISLTQQAKSDDKKKKKKKKKSKSTNLPEAGTELADDYVEKHAEDVIEDPFDPEHPLAQRVEYAIWKYRKNHKFSEEKRAIFDNYLRFGGIKTGPNMFLGRATSADTPDDPEAAVDFEAAKTAIDTVPDQEEEEGLEVNFREVAQVYFGNAFIRQSRFTSMRDFIDAPILIDAFLRYLQIRNVAPEYADDIAGARAICALAKVQLPKCKQIIMQMPGAYNKACADYFGTSMADMDTSWMTETTLTIQKQYMSFLVDTVGTTSEDTKKVVQKRIKNPEQVHQTEKFEWVFVRIAEIAPFSANAAGDDLIQVVFENYQDTQETYKIYLEKEIVEHMLVGMVTALTLCKLSNGEWYIEQARRLMPTFYMEDECMTEEDYDY
ncbi:Argonaute siRNA chaperone complex subunit Arb1-domain-containing protein [Choanephora cucurbitarum]|nr:Argonaute siRNA chaperone complex subunit Arb1-domain-containing protein [Choanephora cucurbitarum]